VIGATSVHGSALGIQRRTPINATFFGEKYLSKKIGIKPKPKLLPKKGGLHGRDKTGIGVNSSTAPEKLGGFLDFTCLNCLNADQYPLDLSGG
jgi:hypothetical protein